MIWQITKTVGYGHNLMDPSIASIGWVDETGELRDCGFHTSHPISVQPGDVVTFGPAVTSQGWHLIGYTQEGKPLSKDLTQKKLVLVQQLDPETAIMQYTVAPGVCQIRVIYETRYLQAYCISVNHPFTAEDYGRMMLESIPSRRFFSRNFHASCWILQLILQGEGDMLVGEQRYAFSPGTVLCLPPGIDSIQQSKQGFSSIQIVVSDFSPDRHEGKKVLLAQDDRNQSMKSLMQLMLRIWWNTPGHDHQLLEQLYATLEQILRYRWEQSQPQHKQVGRMKTIMIENFTDPFFSLDRVFEQQHYCCNHLRRLFKQETGFTPMAYLTHLRIEQAKSLMRNHWELQPSVAEIAERCGFQDPCYFSRVFKQQTGLSPKQYMSQNCR